MDTGAKGLLSDSSESGEAATSDSLSVPKRDLLAILLISAIVIALAMLLAWPWLPTRSVPISQQNLYQPLAHGQATTRVIVNAQQKPQSWVTDNVISIPAWEIFGNNLPPALVDQLLASIPELVINGRFPPAISLFRTRSRIINHDGTAATSETYTLRQPERDQVLAITIPGVENPILYNPPLDLTVSKRDLPTTEQSGTVAGIYTYTLSTSQGPLAEHSTPYGTWLDCRQFTTDLTLRNATDTIGNEQTTSYFCPQVGLVEQSTSDSAGNTTSLAYTWLNLATESQTATTLLPPIQPIAPFTATIASVEQWAYTQLASLSTNSSSATISLAPLYVASPHPYLLTAKANGPLVALDAQQATISWQFQSAGSIYSRPTIDPKTGYIYFGSSDKHLYALTGEGLFLWQVSMNDNIAAPPLLADDMLIAIAEDGTTVALDTTTGAERWRMALGSASVAAPAHFATTQPDLIAVGNEDGLIQVAESATGRVVWKVLLDGAIQAPLLIDNDILYGATVAGGLSAISAQGELLWTSDLQAGVHTVAAIDRNNLYLVDDHGWLYAIARATGIHLWRSHQLEFIGPPIRLTTTDETRAATAELLLVAAADGTMSAFSPRGELLRRWHTEDANTVGSRQTTNFSVGPTFGGGAIWLGNDQSEIYRLGPPLAASQGTQ